jgi:hypothetical protein
MRRYATRARDPGPPRHLPARVARCRARAIPALHRWRQGTRGCWREQSRACTRSRTRPRRVSGPESGPQRSDYRRWRAPTRIVELLPSGRRPGRGPALASPRPGRRPLRPKAVLGVGQFSPAHPGLFWPAVKAAAAERLRRWRRRRRCVAARGAAGTRRPPKVQHALLHRQAPGFDAGRHATGTAGGNAGRPVVSCPLRAAPAPPARPSAPPARPSAAGIRRRAPESLPQVGIGSTYARLGETRVDLCPLVGDKIRAAGPFRPSDPPPDRCTPAISGVAPCRQASLVRYVCTFVSNEGA